MANRNVEKFFINFHLKRKLSFFAWLSIAARGVLKSQKSNSHSLSFRLAAMTQRVKVLNLLDQEESV